MNNACCVGCAEPCSNLRCNFNHGFDLEWSCREGIAYRSAGDVFLRDELPPLEFTDVENGYEIGVIQGGSCARFLAKSPRLVGILRKLRREEFKRNFATQFCVRCEPYFSEAARTEPREDGIAIYHATSKRRYLALFGYVACPGFECRFLKKISRSLVGP